MRFEKKNETQICPPGTSPTTGRPYGLTMIILACRRRHLCNSTLHTTFKLWSSPIMDTPSLYAYEKECQAWQLTCYVGGSAHLNMGCPMAKNVHHGTIIQLLSHENTTQRLRCTWFLHKHTPIFHMVSTTDPEFSVGKRKRHRPCFLTISSPGSSYCIAVDVIERTAAHLDSNLWLHSYRSQESPLPSPQAPSSAFQPSGRTIPKR